MAACSLHCKRWDNYKKYDEIFSRTKQSCKVCMPKGEFSKYDWSFTICSSSHSRSTSFSGWRSVLKASMHGRCTAAIMRVSANFIIIVIWRSRRLAMIVAAENNAIWTQSFPFYKLSKGAIFISQTAFCDTGIQLKNAQN